MADEMGADEIASKLEALDRRLDYIEQNLTRLGRANGWGYTPYTAEVMLAAQNSEFPPDVVELARAGKRIAAIKAYRAATGASLEQARDAVRSI